MSNNIRDVLFVSETYMRETFFLSDNMQSKFILQAVRYAQDTDYQLTIGSCLYNHLKTLVANGEISDVGNEAYKRILDESRMFIGATAVARLCVVSTVHLSNAGLNKIKGGDDFEVLDNEEMFQIKNYYDQEAAHWRKRLEMTLLNIKETDDIPELDECKCDEIRAHLHTAANTTLWLGGIRLH